MSKRTVLCVSDEVSNRNSVADLLKRAGCEVVAVRPRQAAALLAVNRRVDAVVLDQSKEERSGFRLTGLLKSIRPDLPILRVSPGTNRIATCLEGCLSTEDTFEAIPPSVG